MLIGEGEEREEEEWENEVEWPGKPEAWKTEFLAVRKGKAHFVSWGKNKIKLSLAIWLI